MELTPEQGKAKIKSKGVFNMTKENIINTHEPSDRIVFSLDTISSMKRGADRISSSLAALQSALEQATDELDSVTSNELVDHDGSLYSYESVSELYDLLHDRLRIISYALSHIHSDVVNGPFRDIWHAYEQLTDNKNGDNTPSE